MLPRSYQALTTNTDVFPNKKQLLKQISGVGRTRQIQIDVINIPIRRGIPLFKDQFVSSLCCRAMRHQTKITRPKLKYGEIATFHLILQDVSLFWKFIWTPKHREERFWRSIVVNSVNYRCRLQQILFLRIQCRKWERGTSEHLYLNYFHIVHSFLLTKTDRPSTHLIKDYHKEHTKD